MKSKTGFNKVIGLLILAFVVISLVSASLIVFHYHGMFEEEPVITVKPDNIYNETLHVATDYDYKPFSYIEDGEYAGLDVELIAEVANRLKMNLELTLLDWNDAQRGLLDGTYDIILNMESNAILKDENMIGTIPTDEKQYVVYGKNRVSYVGELYGMRVAAYNKFDELGMDVITGYSYQEMFEKLIADELDYVICPIQIGDSFLEKLHAEKTVVSSYQVSYMYGCMALKASDSELCSKLNDVIKTLQTEGVIEKLDNKWVTSRYGVVSVKDILRHNPIIIVLLIIAGQIILIGSFLIFFAASDSRKQKAYAEELQKNIDIINRQNEELILANEKAEAASIAKSNFLSNMSHDIRTPMNAIIGMTEIATKHIDDKNRVLDCLHKITNSGRHLLGLINDVLDMAKIESGKMALHMEDVSLREAMDTICSITRVQITEKSQHFDISISNILCDNVCCDSLRLNQILLNLLSNAIKYTPEEGSIHVRLWQEASPKGDDYVLTHFSVADTGMGMSPEFLETIFDAFTREDAKRVQKTQGTGLGMAITKNIVDAMGGTIEVESEPDKGSTFHVVLDLCRGENTELKMQLPPWKILVVDDNEELCLTAAESLEALGTRPQWCTDGQAALEKVIDAHRRGEDFFAILIDYRMPGMSGIETVKKIRDILGDKTPIEMISAYDQSEIEETVDMAGVSGFIAKPLFRSTLYHELSRFAPQPAELPAEETEIEELSLKGMHILLAEDNDINAEIAILVLEEFGVGADRAEDGARAVEMFEQSAPGYYNAILMDLRMPNMNGLEATVAIRAMQREDAASIPIIAMTADAFAEDAQKCLNAGMNAHLAKPIDVEQLKKTLEKFV
ncbi:MAG: response regulator [Oscillospiraceae bacterium]|nr:response regulator [Oscillospiraceae bacterium]